MDAEPPGGESPRDAKRALARALVERFHGPGSGPEAEAAFDRQFIDHEAPEEVPVLEWPHPDGQVHVPAVLAGAFGISTSEARRSLAQGGVKVDGAALPDGTLDLEPGDIDGKVVQLGRRRFARVQLVSQR